MTRCKFTCFSVKKYKHWNEPNKFIHEAEFNIVMSGSDENKAFFAATPSGNIKIGTYTQDVFEVGKDYYVDITPINDS